MPSKIIFDLFKTYQEKLTAYMDNHEFINPMQRERGEDVLDAFVTKVIYSSGLVYSRERAKVIYKLVIGPTLADANVATDLEVDRVNVIATLYLETQNKEGEVLTCCDFTSVDMAILASDEAVMEACTEALVEIESIKKLVAAK